MLGVVVGWIIVAGFAATLAITLLGLTGRISIPKLYLDRLFMALILELIGAGFFLFYSEFSPPAVRFEPAVGDSELYLFSEQGEPLKETVLKLGDKVIRRFNSQPAVGFETVRRVDLINGQLHVMSQTEGFSLGKISLEDVAHSAGHRLIPFDKHFDLGLHYAECRDCPKDPLRPSDERLDPRRAVSHLFAALESEEQEKGIEHEQAVLALFQLQGYFGSCGDYMKLAAELERHRRAPNRYKELGDVYKSAALHVAELHEKERREARLAALRSFLQYVVNARNGPLFEQAEGEISQIAELDLAVGDKTRSLIESRKYRPAFEQMEISFQCAQQP